MKQHLYSVLAALCTALLLFTGSAEGLLRDRLTAPISASVLRLHIVAASNRPEDQALKYQVRDRVLYFLSHECASASSAAETETMLRSRLPLLEQQLENILSDSGTPCSIEFGDYIFPTRYYSGCCYPCGTYRALRIQLGDGGGRNWWCLLYPPLCIPVVSQSTPEGIAELPVLSGSDPRSPLFGPETSGSAEEPAVPSDSISIQYRFFFWDWIRSRIP